MILNNICFEKNYIPRVKMSFQQIFSTKISFNL